MRSQSRPNLTRSPRRRHPENVCILSSLLWPESQPLEYFFLLADRLINWRRVLLLASVPLFEMDFVITLSTWRKFVFYKANCQTLRFRSWMHLHLSARSYFQIFDWLALIQSTTKYWRILPSIHNTLEIVRQRQNAPYEAEKTFNSV